MHTSRFAVYTASVAMLLCVGCASTPEALSQRQAVDAQIDAILSEPLDAAQYGETKRCLADREYRDFRAIDDRHMLFKGPGGKLWINTLRSRCPDLRYGTVIRVRSISWSRICELDDFRVADWFEWPWYRRWPWHWGTSWATGPQCTLGKFQPVTKEQVEEIEAVLKSR